MLDTLYIFGHQAILKCCQTQPELIQQVFVDQQLSHYKPMDQQLVEQLTQQGIALQPVARQTLDKLSRHGNHQHWAAHIRLPAAKGFDEFKQAMATVADQDQKQLWVFLDGITDPHNLGAILRTCDAAGVQGVVLPKDGSVKLNATVFKVASGAALSVPIYRVTNLARAIETAQSQGLWMYALDERATQTVFSQNWQGHIGIVMGAEGKGLREKTKQLCDGWVAIPMQGTVESLNVSVATGVVLYQVRHGHGAN